MNDPAINNIPEAVTAAIFVDDEVLLLRRNPALRAFSGFQAFPGGKVDACDHGPTVLETAGAAIPARRVNALQRELFEELGVDIAALEVAGEVCELAEIGYALTPPIAPRRFSTWFYRLRLKRKPALEINRAEHTHWEWAPPTQWLKRYEKGELLLVPPTLFALRDLTEDPDTKNLASMTAIGKAPDGGHFVEISPIHGIRILGVPSNTLPPATLTNCFLIGDGGCQAPRLLMDPAPKNDETLEQLCTQVHGRFDAIFLTHHHLDHNERADTLARRFNVPIWLSRDTHQRIAQTRPQFFDNIPTREITGGEDLTRWLGKPVKALAVPGHDAGQLALLPDNHAWCLVGDLIQGIGTVVIAPPEGDMAQYFRTLENVIALAPKTIFPSHGVALGGTYYLEKALSHRQMREQQILELHKAGQSEDDILASVYAGTPEPLLPYARINIQSHMAKLRAEARAG